MEGKIWVHMRNIPRSFYIRDHIVPAMRRTSSSSEPQQRYLPAEENRYLLLSFYNTCIYLLLYIYNLLALGSGSPAVLISIIPSI